MDQVEFKQVGALVNNELVAPFLDKEIKLQFWIVRALRVLGLMELILDS